MKIFAFRKPQENWILPLSAMGLVLGFLIATAYTSGEGRRSRTGIGTTTLRGPSANPATVDSEAFAQLSEEVKKLREDKTALEKTLGKSGDESKILNQTLQETKLLAGLSDVTGPGVRIILRDSTKNVGVPEEAIIHDLDVLRTVNELWAAGAEAISINDHRITGGSSIRCVGPTILINDVKIASPVVIRAIGDAKTLMGGLEMPDGILSNFREVDPGMVQIEEMKTLRLPAFVGTTTRRFAKPSDPPKAAE